MKIHVVLCSLAATGVLSATYLLGAGPAVASSPTSSTPTVVQPVHDPTTPAPTPAPTTQPTPDVSELEPGELEPTDAESLGPPQAATAAQDAALSKDVTGEASTEVVWEGTLPSGMTSANKTTILKTLQAGQYDLAGVAAEKAAAEAPTSGSRKTSKITSHIRLTPVGVFNYSAGGINFKIPTGCWYSTNIKYNEVTSYVKEGMGWIWCYDSVAKVIPNWCLTNQALRVYDASGKRVYRKYTTLDTKCHFGDNTAVAHLTGIPYQWARYGKARMTFYVGHKARVWKSTPIHS